MLKRNQESWSNCSTNQLYSEKAIRIWNSTKTGNNGLKTSPDNKVYKENFPLNSYSDLNLIAESKKSLRKAVLTKRSALSDYEVKESSRLICGIFTGLPEYKSAKNIAIYSPVRNEVDTHGLFNKIVHDDKNCFFPKVVNNKLYFHKITDLKYLETGYAGIPEPANPGEPVSISDIDLFVVPGLCFDINGQRLGYGKGLYDMTLEDVSSSKIYAFCYSFQILNEVPSDKHDKKVGHVVNESGIVSFKI